MWIIKKFNCSNVLHALSKKLHKKMLVLKSWRKRSFSFWSLCLVSYKNRVLKKMKSASEKTHWTQWWAESVMLFFVAISQHLSHSFLRKIYNEPGYSTKTKIKSHLSINFSKGKNGLITSTPQYPQGLQATLITLLHNYGVWSPRFNMKHVYSRKKLSTRLQFEPKFYQTTIFSSIFAYLKLVFKFKIIYTVPINFYIMNKVSICSFFGKIWRIYYFHFNQFFDYFELSLCSDLLKKSLFNSDSEGLIFLHCFWSNCIFPTNSFHV